MISERMTGEEALAYGALAAGVQMVTGYPGSPSSGTMDALIAADDSHRIYIEWSSNERVALEMAIGASIAGRRALVCTKSVGMNVLLDPLMALNLTPLRAGLVILLGDDPGGYGSQNDQDTRPLATMSELPMLEPGTPAEAYDMVRAGFALSEQHQMPVVIRETRSFAVQLEMLKLTRTPCDAPKAKETIDPMRFVPVPKNVVQKHRDLHQRFAEVTKWSQEAPFNRMRIGGKDGLIAAGFVYQKCLDVVGQEEQASFALFKIGTLHPLPERKLLDFMASCDNVLVLEETSPFVELAVRALAQTHDLGTTIFGKHTGHVPREGELFRWQIQSAVCQLFPYFTPVNPYRPEKEPDERPPKKSYCSDCRYDEILDLCEEAARRNKQAVAFVGDPGCLVTVAHRLYAKYAIGSAVAVADGMARAGFPRKAVALVGDSGFFHSTLPALCNAVHHHSDLLIIVLNNSTTLTSGGQPHAGTPQNARGEAAKALNISAVSRACGVDDVRTISLDSTRSELVVTVQNMLRKKTIAMLIIDIPEASGQTAV